MKSLNKYLLLLLTLAIFAFDASAQCTGLVAPFTETFDNGTFPTCWTESATSGGPWDVTPTFFNTVQCSAAFDHTGNGGNFMGVDMSGTDVGVVLETADIDVSALTTPSVSFYYWMCDVGYTPANELHVEAFDGTSWNTVGSILNGTSGWELFIFDLSTHVYNSTFVKLRFRAESGGATFDYYGDHGLDDVSVDEAPTCFAVSNASATLVNGSDVSVSWTGNTTTPASNFLIEYGPAGFSLGTGTLQATTTSPTVITNLAYSTDYSFYIYPLCSPTDTGFIASAGTITTPCATFIAPHLETFGSGTTPNCWSQGQTTGEWLFANTTSYTTYASTTPASVTADGSHFAWLDFSTTSSPRILTMNEVDISNLPSAALSFWMFSWSSYQANSAQNTLEVEASDGAGNWVPITTINQDSDSWQFKLYDLANYTYGPNNEFVQIRFNGIAQTSTGTAYYNDILIDNVKIDELPTAACAPINAPDTMGFEDGGVLNACWEQSTTDSLDWSINMGPTATAGTGPSASANGTYYAYLESSAPVAVGDFATLISPPINTAALADAPAIYFNYHMFGNDSMTLKVEYEIFGSDSWTTVWEQVGQVQTASTDNFQSAYIPLPDAIGALIRVRFIAVAGQNTPGSTLSELSDIAIDDIRIQNVLANDVAVTDIITPGNDCGLGNLQPITLEVTNRGFNDQTNTPIFVSVNGGTSVGTTIPSISGNNGTATINLLVDMSDLGTYTISATTALSGDEVTDNDMMTTTAYHQPQITGEYSMEYEMSNGYWYSEGAWEHGTPTGTIIDAAASGTNAYVTNLSGNYTDSEISYLYSPCFDLSTMTQPLLKFSINWDIEDNMDGAWLEYSIGGNTWTKLGSNNLSGQNWYNDSISQNSLGWVWNGSANNGSQGWLDAIIDLQPYGVTISQNVRFRFVLFADAATTNEGLGIDNFGISDGCLYPVDNETIVHESRDGQADGSISLNPILGIGGYTYLWSDGSTNSSISGLAPGTYSVTITDPQGCVLISSFEILSLCPTDLGLVTTTTPEIGDDEDNGSAIVAANAGTPPYSYNWSNGATSDEIFNLGEDTYTVVVTDSVGCTDTATVEISTIYTVGTENLDGLTTLLLSPNPAKDYTQLNIQFENAVDLSVRLVDITGRVLENRNLGNTDAEDIRFELNDLAEGVYFIQITANQQTATKRFVLVK